MSKRKKTTKNAALEIPKCGAVISSRVGQLPELCSEYAKYAVQLTDPDNSDTITSTLLLCDKHSSKLENGKSLLLLDASGKLIIARFDFQ